MTASLRASILAAAVCGLAVACSSAPASGPEQAVQLFYEQLNDGDYANAMSLYNAEALEILEDPAGGDSGFSEWAQQETKGGKVDRVELVLETRTESGADVEFDVIYKDGTSKRTKVSLSQEDGQWKLGFIG